MVLFLVLFLVFAIVAASCWFQGLWSNVINIINILLAGLIATNFWEPIATAIEGAAGPASAYLLDAPILWALFSLSYIVLRSITQSVSKYNVYFIKPVELAGRSILAIWSAWLFTCFTAFTLLVTPIGGSPAGSWSTPQSKSFLFLSPEQQWLSLAQSRSVGALSRGAIANGPEQHPEDRPLDVNAFDPYSEFTFKYYARRTAGAN